MVQRWEERGEGKDGESEGGECKRWSADSKHKYGQKTCAIKWERGRRRGTATDGGEAGKRRPGEEPIACVACVRQSPVEAV
jgi:hypothetical protein